MLAPLERLMQSSTENSNLALQEPANCHDTTRGSYSECRDCEHDLKK